MRGDRHGKGTEPCLQKRDKELPDSVTLGKKKVGRTKDGIRRYVYRSVTLAWSC